MLARLTRAPQTRPDGPALLEFFWNDTRLVGPGLDAESQQRVNALVKRIRTALAIRRT